MKRSKFIALIPSICAMPFIVKKYKQPKAKAKDGICLAIIKGNAIISPAYLNTVSVTENAKGIV